jgi:hypothetical protein
VADDRGADGSALGGGGKEGGEVGVEVDDAADVAVEVPDEADVAGEVGGHLGLVVLVDLVDERPVLVQQALHLHEARLERVQHLGVRAGAEPRQRRLAAHHHCLRLALLVSGCALLSLWVLFYLSFAENCCNQWKRKEWCYFACVRIPGFVFNTTSCLVGRCLGHQQDLWPLLPAGLSKFKALWCGWEISLLAPWEDRRTLLQDQMYLANLSYCSLDWRTRRTKKLYGRKTLKLT